MFHPTFLAAMIGIHISQQDAQRIKHLSDNDPHPRVRRRMQVLWLKSQGVAHKEICRLTGINRTTLCKYLRMFQSGGVEKLREINFYAPQSALAQHRCKLEAYFRKHPPATIKEAMAKIEELTGLKRSPSAVGKFLNTVGMRPRKVGAIPSQGDPEKQEEFRIKELEPRLEEARQGKRAVFFVDAAHFVLSPFLGILWSFVRLFVKASAGRRRFNVLGALHAITHQLVMVTNDSYINAQSVCDLLRKIAAMKLDVPITLVLDNARYQKCRLVTALALSLNIELLFLPPYSPNLNLIERLWKFVKKQVLYSRYYSDFGDFKRAIRGCLNQTHTTHKKELDSLLTLKFQVFKKVNIVPI
jgi:transposase